MSALAHDLVWAAGLLEGCPNVEVIGLRVDVDSLHLPEASGPVPLVVLDVHAASQADAAVLASSLQLREVAGRVTESEWYGTSVWRTWQGWAAEGSRDAAVVVRVTGADRIAGSDNGSAVA
jgi:hypothetical protein